MIESLNPEQLRLISNSLSKEELANLKYYWPFWARPNQILPESGWSGALILAGRGFGKTRLGAEWVRYIAENALTDRIGLIAETAKDGRDVMVQGESGLLAISPPWNRPDYFPSKKRLVWKNGVQAFLYDAREPDQLRGPQHGALWFDELAKYRYASEVFEQALYGLRLGENPRWIATSTPRNIPLIKNLLKQPGVHVVRASSLENLANLPNAFKTNVIDRAKDTRLGRQEIYAEILEDSPGALWNLSMLERSRIKERPELIRIVVGIDPATTSSENSNETGIIVCGIDNKNTAYVLDDYSLRGTPDEWGKRAVQAFNDYKADNVVVEVNQGGQMVEALLRSVSPYLPVTSVRATRGKYIRAEPIAALYIQGRVRHVGTHATLEDQMITFTPDSIANRKDSGVSPDRVDALVWALSFLFPEMLLPAPDLDEMRREESLYEALRYARNDITGY